MATKMIDNKLPIFGVSDFVAVFNQSLEITFPRVVLVGELSNLRVRKGRWVYFDLKDDTASVSFFGTVYSLPGPLEDGMMIRVTGAPRLHPLYGFSVSIETISVTGEGSLQKAAKLLETKLRREGLFDIARKRTLPYPPPSRIGLISSIESAAYADFIKIIGQRWSGLTIEVADVQVQGDVAPRQIASAIQYFNQSPVSPDVLVIIRGGGSADDLAAFDTEQVVRAIAGSRTPTMVAIGHEIDLSLAELAADKRASTPSNAAELLVPDKTNEHLRLSQVGASLRHQVETYIGSEQSNIHITQNQLRQSMRSCLENHRSNIEARARLIGALNPVAILERGYSIVRRLDSTVSSIKQVAIQDKVRVQMRDGSLVVKIEQIIEQ